MWHHLVFEKKTS